MERKSKWSSLVEGLFGPVEGRGEGEGKGEEIEKKNPGGGLFKIRAEGGEVFAESVLMEILNGRIRGEEGELRAAGKSAGSREAGSNAMASRGSVDREKEG